MMETSARVTRVAGELAWVRAESVSSCGACGGKGCGSSIFTRMLHPREPEYPVLNQIGAETGDIVVVGVEEGVLVRAAMAGYFLPLLTLVIGASIGNLWGESQAVAGGALGLVGAAVWLKLGPVTPSPVILRKGFASCAGG